MLKSANFLTSAQNIAQCPPPMLSEVAFLGRSNVGKSTLIKFIISALDVDPETEVCYVAFTGKAATVLQ